jgi:hypothetical protein
MTQVRHVVSKIPYILIYLVAGMGIALVAYVVFLSLQPDPRRPRRRCLIRRKSTHQRVGCSACITTAKRLCIPRC